MNPATPAAQVRRLVAGVTAANRWRDGLNPLRNLTMPRAVAYMEDAQQGIMADLQWLYGCETGIEATDADLMVIIDRTLSALRDCEWQVEILSKDTKGFDAALAAEQESLLREHYESCDNLYEAFGHLALARFRGYAHLNPHFTHGGLLRRLEPLDQWNFARDGYRGDWYWNPQARHVPAKALPRENRLHPRDYILIDYRRPVNRIGLIKYIRATVAEKDWDAYVETYGLPGAFVIMPQITDPALREEFADAAEEAARAGSGALPNGSQVTIPAAGERAMQPFQPRLEWLQKHLVLAGTGGLLTVLAESGSGTLAGSVHEQAFRQIGRAIARMISESFQGQFDRPLLAEAFPGRAVLAYFDLKARQERDTKDIVGHVVALTNAGYRIDNAQVQQETGYRIIGFEAPSSPAGPPAGLMRAEPPPQARLRSTQPDAPTEALRASAAALLAEAIAEDCAPLASRLQAALAESDFDRLQAALRAILADLPQLASDLLEAPASVDAFDRTLTAALIGGMLDAARAKPNAPKTEAPA